MSKALWYVYIILTEKKRLYTGITTNMERRWKQHTGEQSGGAKFFRSDKPFKIVHIKSYSNRSEATIQEITIKKMTRKQKDIYLQSFSS